MAENERGCDGGNLEYFFGFAKFIFLSVVK